MSNLRSTYDEAVASSAVTEPVDVALIEAGRTIADRIDAAVAFGEGQEVTKALYLVPHMVNILRELLATPASRKAAGASSDSVADSGGHLAKLRAVKSAAARRSG